MEWSFQGQDDFGDLDSVKEAKSGEKRKRKYERGRRKKRRKEEGRRGFCL
jgi:hypothetical protein